MHPEGWILVAGFGSIGRRHYRNLRSLGIDDVRLLRSGRRPTPGFETPTGVTAYSSLADALDDKPSVVVVANPTSLHVEVAAKATSAGALVVLEKPVGSDLASALRLLRAIDRTGGVISMAYCFRYHPLYVAMRDVINSGILGRVFHVDAWQANYLPDWHPWEDYRESYAARSDLGGGVVRTLDHELDMLNWLFGKPSAVVASVGSMSGIGVPVDDTADMIFRYEQKMQARVHVSFGRRDYSRGMVVVGEAATARLDWSAGYVQVIRGSEQLLEDRHNAMASLDEMYLDMMKSALDGFGRTPAMAAIPLEDGVLAMRMAESALLSSEQGRTFEIRS